MAGNLTDQVRNIAEGDHRRRHAVTCRKKITVDARGEILELKNTINTMVDQLNSFAAEVTRVATRSRHRRQARWPGRGQGRFAVYVERPDRQRSTPWPANLTVQLRDVSKVSTAIANGRSLTQKITVEVRGEILQIKDVINKSWSTSSTRSPPR